MSPRFRSLLTLSLLAGIGLHPLAAQGRGAGGRGAGGRGAGGAAGAAGAGAPAAAQTPPPPPQFGVKPVFPTNDAVLQKIYYMGMDSSWTKKLAHSLLDSLGPRLMGSPNIEAAQNFMVQSYKSWGIDARNEKYGTWRGWRRGYSHIDLISPRVRTLSGTMAAWSPGTKKKDLDVQTIILPLNFRDSTEFVKWLPQAKGKLVLAFPAVESCRLPSEIQAMGTAYTDSVYSAQRATTTRTAVNGLLGRFGFAIALGGGTLGMRLEEGGAAGLITSLPKEGAGLAMEVFETYNTKTPTIALTCEDYGLVYRLTASGSAPKLRLNLDSELLGERPVFNTIATIKGTTKPDEVVFFSAHFDSWDGSSGATDNGTGTLMMMEAMRLLKAAYPNPKRTIMVGHWSGEEEGLVGSQAFAEDHPEITSKITAFFNQDNGTGRISGVNAAGFLSMDKAVASWVARMPDNVRNNFRYSGVGSPSRGGTPGGTDSGSFACYSVPTLGLNSATNWNYSNLTWHTEKDTYDKVAFDDLRWNATVVAMLAYMAADDPQFATRNTPAQNDSMWNAGGAGARGGNPGRGGAGAASTLPAGTVAPCPKAVRSTKPRLR